MIKINNLSKSFGKKKVLSGISLSLKEAGVTAILGPNGSGKTTLIKCLMGMVLPDDGDIYFGGTSIRGEYLYREDIGYLPQIARFPENLKVKELITWIVKIRKQVDNRNKYIEAFGIQTVLDQTLGTLSGGTRQKVNLILALMHDHPVLVLDEPTVGLDPVALVVLKSILREERDRGKIILISTHIMDFVDQVADRIVYLLDGSIYYDGTLGKLKEKHGVSTIEEVIVRILSDKSSVESLAFSGR
jgi:Cu-processing system ATP-binding protein